MDPSRYYHLSSFYSGYRRFWRRARVSWSVTDGQTRLCFFVLDASLFQSFLTAEPSEAVRRIPAFLARGFYLYSFLGACAPESVRAISTARLNTSP